MSKNKIVCLTPVKNESWIIEKFIKSVLLWADYLIIADQMSEDGTREVIKRFSKTNKIVLINNNGTELNEYERQKLLINKARSMFKDPILISLDADEFLTLYPESINELDDIKKLEKGTVIKFDWANLILKENKFWYAPQKMPLGFVDDGSEHVGTKIHSMRIPLSKIMKSMHPKYLKVMHFQYVNWDRMKSKHRWYQCWEKLNNPEKNSVYIYRQYHHMYAVDDNDLRKIPIKWFSKYKKCGIDLKTFDDVKDYWWDKEVLQWMEKYGATYFKKLDIWDKDWVLYAKELGIKNPNKFIDNKNLFEKLIFNYLKMSQRYSSRLLVILLDKLACLLYL